MKSAFILAILIANSCIAQESSKLMTYTITDEMILNFDPNTFEIILTDAAKKDLFEVDFLEYGYVDFERFDSKVILIESTMSFRPPDIFIYKYQSTIFFRPGVIKIEIGHLENNDPMVLELKRILTK